MDTIKQHSATVIRSLDYIIAAAAIIVIIALFIAGHPAAAIHTMAAVTVVRQRRTVFGDKKVKLAEISGGNTDTFDTGMRKVEQIAMTPKTNAPTAFAESVVSGKIRLTLTTGGAFTNVKLAIFGN